MRTRAMDARAPEAPAVTTRPRRRSAALVLTLVSAALLSPSVALGADTVEQARTLQSAHGFLGKGLYEMAAQEYRSYVQQSDDADPSAHYGLAVALQRLGDPAGALESLGRIGATSGFAFAAEAGYLSGACLYELGRYGDAAAVFDEFLQEHTDHAAAPQAGLMLIESLGQSGELDDQAGAARAFLRFWPEHGSAARVRFLMGTALAATGETDDAAEAFEQVVREGGADAADAAYRLGLILESQGDTVRAGELYETAARGDNAAVTPLAELALTRQRREAGDAQGARAAAARWLNEHRGHASADAARLVLGRALIDLGRPGEALQPLGQAAESDDRATAQPGMYWLAKAQLAAGDAAAAEDTFNTTVQALEQDDALMPYALYDRAAARRARGDRGGAEEGFREMRDAFSRHELVPHALYAEAALALEDDRAGEAERLAQRLVSSYPQHALAPDALVLLADTQYFGGDHGDAARTLRTLEQRFPEEMTPYAQYRLGLALERSGDADSAAETLAAAAAHARDDERLRPALLAMADLAHDRGDWDAAEEHAGDYLALAGSDAGDPNARRAMLTRGLALAELGRHREAMDDFRSLIETDAAPETAHALYAAGVSSRALGDDAASAEMLHELLGRDDAGAFEPFAYRVLGAMALEQGDSSAAAVWYEKASGGEGDDPADYLNRARALLAAGKAEDAVRVLSAPGLAGADEGVREQADAVRAMALSRSGDHRRALSLFRTLEDAETLDARTRDRLSYERALSLIATDQTDEAARVLEGLLDSPALGDRAALELAALAMDRDDAEAAAGVLDGLLAKRSTLGESIEEQAVYRRGVCAHLLGDAALAAELLGAFHDEFPGSAVGVSADLIAGRSMQTLGRHRDSVGPLRRVVSAPGAGDEQTEPALLMQADALAESHQFGESLRAAREHRERFPESAMWYQSQFAVGWAQENLGEFDAAIASYRPVADDHRGETAARAQFQIGECLFAQGRHDEAAAELVKVDILHASDLWSAAALYEAGRCFEAANKTGEARAQYRETVSRFPDSDWAEPARQRLDALRRSAPGRGDS